MSKTNFHVFSSISACGGWIVLCAMPCDASIGEPMTFVCPNNRDGRRESEKIMAKVLSDMKNEMHLTPAATAH